jgi:hypothetical protein
MRIFVLALTFIFAVFIPALLVLFAPGKPLRTRAFWALAAVLSPLATFGIVRLIPLLSNNTPEAVQWERFAGLLLSGSGFILPWIIFAVFLHKKTAS